MKRSLWGSRQHRSDSEFVPARPGPSMTAPARTWSALQQRGPLAVNDEHLTPAAYGPADQFNGTGAPFGIDQDVGGNASAATLALPEAEAELHRQSEITRIRNEIMDIAREVAELRRRDHADPAPAATKNGSRPPYPQSTAVVEPQKNPAPVSAGAESRSRLQEPRPQASNSRRALPVERAHRNSRAGKTETAANTVPPRVKQPPLIICEYIAPAMPKHPAMRDGAGQLGIMARTALLTGVMLAVLSGASLVTLGLLDRLPLPGEERQSPLLAETTASVPTVRPSQASVTSLAERAPATYPFEIPDNYGVYAVNDGHLTPLDPLPVRLPDARVSISSPISKPAPAPLANGNLQFVVYHRELATNVPESASVRIVAKVMQATTFAGGKPKAAPVEDTWAVRGGLIDFRIAPVAANKEMIFIRPADPRLTLTPGRYVLMFRNQAYDFSVAGEVSDTAHCLERSDLEDRSVYSECRQLPASTTKS